jgi:hypothetical protein
MSVRLTRTPDGRIMMVNRNTGTSQVFEPRPQIRPRETTFSENMTDLLSSYIGKDAARSLFGKRRVGGGGDILSNIVDDAGLANITPISAGVMSGGQAVKDLRSGDYGSAAANAALAGLDLGLSGYGLRQLYKNAPLRKQDGGILNEQPKVEYDDAAHYMRVNEMIGNMLRPPSATMPEYIPPRFDRLGVHVGTPEQAADRFKMGGTGRQGQTFPLKIRTDKPFEIKDFEEFGINPDIRPHMVEIIDGKKVLNEDGVREAMNAYADAKNVDLDKGVDLFRKELTDKGYTNIPYVNLIEGARKSIKTSDGFFEFGQSGDDYPFTKENISNIMLVDRTANDPAVIKSRFAKFKDLYDPNIMAGLAGLGLLSQIENEEGE